jgi:hypothetical protein
MTAFFFTFEHKGVISFHDEMINSVFVAIYLLAAIIGLCWYGIMRHESDMGPDA